MLTASLYFILLAAQDDKAAEEAIDRFKKSYNTATNVAGRVAAVTDLSRTPHERTRKKLLEFLGQDAKEVRAAAARGLANFKDYRKVVTPMLMAALGGVNAKEYEVQAAIYETLGKLQDENALQTIHKGFREDCIKVAKAAVLAAGDAKFKESLEPLLQLMKDCEKWLKNKQSGGYKDDQGKAGDESAAKARVEDLQKTIIKAFQALTGEKWTTAQEWEIWVRKHGATFKPPKP